MPTGIHPAPSERPIFVTGAPRSGTSWLGELLAGACGLRMVYEPFNPQWNPHLEGKVSQFLYHSAESLVERDHPFVRAADRAFAGRQTLKQLARAAYRGYLGRTVLPSKRVLVKDPTAVLLSEWLYRHYQATVVVIQRHPCAVLSSLRQLGWGFHLPALLSQESLVRDYLADYAADLQQETRGGLREAAAFWCALHIVLQRMADKHAHWHLISYEALCSDTPGVLAALESELELVPSRAFKQTGDVASERAESDPGSTRRDSKSMPEVWRKRLTPSEQEEILSVVAHYGLKPEITG